MEDTINVFLANTTKGYEPRKELFNKISIELYDVFYKNKEVNFDIDNVFETWLNLAGALAENFESLKILFFIVENQSMFKEYHFLTVKVLLDDKKWLNYFDNLTAREALILHKIINIGNF